MLAIPALFLLVGCGANKTASGSDAGAPATLTNALQAPASTTVASAQPAATDGVRAPEAARAPNGKKSPLETVVAGRATNAPIAPSAPNALNAGSHASDTPVAVATPTAVSPPTPTPTPTPAATTTAAPTAATGLPWCPEGTGPRKQKPNAPPVPQCTPMPNGDRPNGMDCTWKTQCASNFCNEGPNAKHTDGNGRRVGVCGACKTDADCGGGDNWCSMDPKHAAASRAHNFTASVCIYVGAPAAPSGGGSSDDDDDRSSSSSPSRNAPPRSHSDKLEHGRMCSKGSECESGVCKMENRTRGRCQ